MLGNETASTVCRHERFEREPTLRTALSYEAIYQKPARELFAGLYHEIEHEVAERAKRLTSQTDLQKSNRRNDQKHQTLTKIPTKESDQPDNAS